MLEGFIRTVVVYQWIAAWSCNAEGRPRPIHHLPIRRTDDSAL